MQIADPVDAARIVDEMNAVWAEADRRIPAGLTLWVPPGFIEYHAANGVDVRAYYLEQFGATVEVLEPISYADR